MAKTIQDLGLGIGFIYVQEANTLDILSSSPNTAESIRVIKDLGAQSTPIASEIIATGSVDITGDFTHAGDDLIFTLVAVDGVNQIGASVTFTASATKEVIAAAIRDAVNSFTPASGPDYTAQITGGKVILVVPSGLGSTVNGDLVSVTLSGPASVPLTTTNMDGGTSSDAITDSGSGYNFFLDADYGVTESAGGGVAKQGDISNALDITNFIVPRGSQAQIIKVDDTIATDILPLTSFVRSNNVTRLVIDTEGAAATDDIEKIETAKFLEFDRLLISGKDAARVVTFIDKTLAVGPNNINLQGQADFLTGDAQKTIELELINDPVDGLVWNEVTRNPSAVNTVAEQRAAGFNQGAPGFLDITIPNGGGTVELEVGVDPEIIRIIGSPTLTAPWSLVMKPATTAKKGDKFFIIWNATVTPAGNAVSIFGSDISGDPLVSASHLVFATFTADGAPGSPFVRWVNEHFSAGMIREVNLATDSVTAVKLKTDAVTAVKIKALAVTTAKIALLAVNTAQLAASAVNHDKILAALITEVVTLPVSFEAGEIGEYQIKLPYKCQVVEVVSRTNLLIEATDDATVQLANTSGNMSNGLLTHAGGAAFGDTQTVSPTTNNEILAGAVMKATTAKTTAGGKAILAIRIIKIS